MLDRRLAIGLMAIGAVLLIVSAFMPQHSSASGDLFTEGTGWGFIVGAALLIVVNRRSVARDRFPWAGLWVGMLAVLNAIALAGDHTFRPLGAGAVTLGLGGVVVLTGWTLLFSLARPEIAGVGRVTTLMRARPGTTASTSDQTPTAGPPASASARPPSVRLARSPVLWALLGYAALSFAYWGLPVLGHFHTTLIAANDIDPAVFTWFYSWWPHAILHGHDPFVTKVLLAPNGYNLSWATAVPAPSLLSSPVTALFGAVVTYNLLALAAPALAAWTAFLLCRHLSGRTIPSLAGGYIFGFSPYMLRMLQGTPAMYFVALIPLLVLVIIQYLEGALRDRTFVVTMAVLVALQFVTTVELVATSSIFGAVGLIAAFALCPSRRPAIARTVRLLVVAYVGAAVLVSPMIYFMLFHGHTTPYNNGPLLASDLLSWIYPDPALAVATTHQVVGTPGYFGGLAYFTAPLLLVVAIWSWERRGDWLGRLLAVCFAVPAVFSLGSLLRVHDHLTRIGLPWSDLAHFPGLRLLVPQRFAMYAFLAAAVIVALWLSSRVSTWRWALVLVAAALMVPNFGSPAFKTPLNDPPFFTSDAYRAYLRPSDRVITIPIIGESMRWQAETHFGFQIAGGGLGTFPASYTRYPTFLTLLSGRLTPDYAAQLRAFVADKGVTAVVISKRQVTPQWLKLFASLGVRPVDTGGVLFYRIRGTDPRGSARAERAGAPAARG